MENILKQIVEHKKIEVEAAKKLKSLELLQAEVDTMLCLDSQNVRSFSTALRNSTSGIIAEMKRRSPSKGWIAEQAEVQDVVSGYDQCGASAMSILTDTKFFGGSLADLVAARKWTEKPLLRKDFMIDPYQIFEAKISGADAILLIASVLTPEEVEHFSVLAHKLKMEVLLEIHNQEELKHLCKTIDVVGVNNRNLATFETNIQRSIELSSLIPGDCVKISESGIDSPQTIKELQKHGFRGFLMGESFMKTPNPPQALAHLIAQL